MKDRDGSTLVAGQLADVKESIDSMRDTMGKRAPPVVTVHVPETAVNVKMPENVPPNIHLNFEAPSHHPPQVTFQVPDAPPPTIKVDPIVNVLPPEARSYTCRITERDSNGFILAFTIVPA